MTENVTNDIFFILSNLRVGLQLQCEGLELIWGRDQVGRGEWREVVESGTHLVLLDEQLDGLEVVAVLGGRGHGHPLLDPQLQGRHKLSCRQSDTLAPPPTNFSSVFFLPTSPGDG